MDLKTSMKLARTIANLTMDTQKSILAVVAEIRAARSTVPQVKKPGPKPKAAAAAEVKPKRKYTKRAKPEAVTAAAEAVN